MRCRRALAYKEAAPPQKCALMIVVTGGAGFIGSNLVAALEERGGMRIAVCDVLDHPAKKANLEKRNIEVHSFPTRRSSDLDRKSVV